MGKINYCSFCGNEIDWECIGFEGVDAWICQDCLELYNEMLTLAQKETLKQQNKPNPKDALIRPKYIYEKLSESVIGQDRAKKILAVALYQHYQRITTTTDQALEKSNILMVGPTGVGKTLLAKTMANILNLPLAICDATVYTQAGYVGEDVENILLKLLQNANYDLELAEKGIVFIDEFDKLARKGENPSITRDVSGEGVQNSLLKIIEGNVVNVPPQGGRKHPYQECIPFDTSKVLFICAGAFDGLEPQNSSVVGFGPRKMSEEEIDTIKLQKYGIIPEILGRLPVIAKLHALTVEELEAILTKPKGAIVKQYQTLFALDHVNLVFEESALHQIALKAHEDHLGARALRKIMEDLMLDIMFELPFDDGTSEIVINQDQVLQQEKQIYHQTSA